MDSDRKLVRAGWLRQYWPMLALLCAGLIYSHHAILFSGFRVTSGDPGDAYLSNYLLEHDYRWALQQPSHERFWDTPMFYPQPNTTAYTETLLGGLPFYAPWRLLGFAPDTSFQLWFLVVAVLNYLSCYFLLSRLLGAGEIASHGGAFFLAFSSARMIQEWHPQLVPAFYLICSFAGAWLFFGGDSARPGRTWTAALLLVGGAVAQMYTSVYMAWFLMFAYFIAAIITTAHPDYRPHFFSRVRHGWGKLTIVGIIGTVAAWPLLIHSLAAAREIGYRPYEAVRWLLPGFPSYLKQSRGSWLYGWLDPFIRLPQLKGYWEESNGVGIATSILVLWGFWIDRRPASKLLATVCGLLFLLTLRLPNGLSLWKFVHASFPGAGAIQAVGRVGLFLLFPAAIALTAAVQRISGRFSPRVAAICCLIVVAEQGISPPVYDKLVLRQVVQNVASQLPTDCEGFLFSPPAERWSPVLGHTVGLWTQISTAIPTLNAHSGGFPRDWDFSDPRMGSDFDYKRLRHALLKWERAHATLRQVCWLRPADNQSDYGRERAAVKQPILELERVALSGENPPPSGMR